MDQKTRSALAELNRAFYARFADDFARTRRGWPPSFERILPHLRSAANVLDIGCGNGRLLAFLAERGWRGRYVGVDSSAELLAVARASADRGWTRLDTGCAAHFAQVDLLESNFLASARRCGGAGRFAAAFDAIACLAVLHHIPGAEQRGRLIADCAGSLAPGGVLIVSTWQFLAAPRLRARILPWATIGLQDADVEPDDHLIGWGKGAVGQRYCAAISEATLRGLAAQAGLATVETFFSDGHEGNLNLYGVFTAT